MGMSTIRYRDRNFRTSDDAIAVWLALLVREIDALPDAPGWMRKAREAWHVQATEGFGFGVVSELDRFAPDDQRRDTLVQLSQRALSHLQSWGPWLPKEALNALHTGGAGVVFEIDVPAEIFVRTARWFIRLLSGTLSSDEQDALVPLDPES